MGTRMRLTMNAGKSSDETVDLPSLSANTLTEAKVDSSVAMPRINSTSFMTGTGFMKWMPMNRSGRSVTAAKRVMEMEEVLEQSRASGFRPTQISLKIF